jgi:hypothetical protein
MNTNEIKVGKKYKVKVGRNEIEVTIVEQTARGWNVKAPSGNKFPVNNAERFIKCLDEPEELSQNLQAEKPKMSMLDAAVEVLKDASRPMSAKEMITAMAEKGLWKSPSGKTPENSLSSAILRETKSKENPRFKKVEKGKFALN